MQNHAIWIQAALLSILKLKMFMKILRMMLKKDLILQIMMLVDHPLQERIKKYLGGKITTEIVALRPKTYSYLMDDGSNDKKAKGTKE